MGKKSLISKLICAEKLFSWKACPPVLTHLKPYGVNTQKQTTQKNPSSAVELIG